MQDNGKPLSIAHHIDLPVSINTLEYYAGWADGKICGQTVSTVLRNFAKRRPA